MAPDRERTWKLVSTGAGVLAGLAVRRALTSAWTRTTGDDPPGNPAAPSQGWTTALAWAAATGAGIGMARLVAARLAAAAWEAATDEAPPGLETSAA